jgi:CelD/BcsL family acetyltransferase involved in cellulose biosynthesis
VEHHASIEAVREDWTALALESGSVFSTWEWARTWLRHLGRGTVDVCVFGEGAQVVAILPLSRRRLPVGTLIRFIGHGPADELGPVARPERLTAAYRSLRELLDAEGSAIFVGDRLRRGPWLAPVGGRRISATPSPVLTLHGRDWTGYLSSRTANFRQQLGRKERRVADAGGAFRLSDGDRLSRDLDVLFALHRERWGGTPTAFARLETFHRDFAEVAMRRGWLRLWFLEIRGEPAAAWLGFRYGSSEAYYQAGRARRFDALSPGLVLMAHTIRAAAEDGLGEYRFLRGDEAFKGRFTDEEVVVDTVAAARGASASAALALAVLGRRALRGIMPGR